MNDKPRWPECDYLITNVDRFLTNMDGWDIWFADSYNPLDRFMIAVRHEPELHNHESRLMYTVYWWKPNEGLRLANYAGTSALPDSVRDYVTAYLKLIS